MSDKPNVIKFFTATNPDHILEQAVGDYGDVVVIGYDKEGHLDVRANIGFKAADILFCVEQFKCKLLAGDYFEEESE